MIALPRHCHADADLFAAADGCRRHYADAPLMFFADVTIAAAAAATCHAGATLYFTIRGVFRAMLISCRLR